MKALFLDDMFDRHEIFKVTHGKQFEITHVFNYDAGILALKEEDFDILFLDHDLSETAIMCDPDDIDERTGTDFARHIIKNFKPEGFAGIIVHSLNPVGRKRMVNDLTNAGFDAKELPFYRLTQLQVK